VANRAPADTEVNRKLLNASPRIESQRVEALNVIKAAVFLSKYLKVKKKVTDSFFFDKLEE